jgi:hypothetical protein
MLLFKDFVLGQPLRAENIPAHGTQFYTDEWQSYRGSHPSHATVRHGMHEWARDDDGDGRREVHCDTCEGVARRSEPIRVVFGAFISDTCIFT